MKAPSPAFWRGWLGWGLSGIDEDGRCSSSFLQGHPPSLRFGHPDVTFGRHRPSAYTLGYPRWRAVFSGCALRVSHGRSPMRSEERAERPGDGCPCVGAEETCGVPSQPAGRGRTPPLNTYQNAELRRLVQNLLGVLFSSFIRGSHLFDEVLFLFEECGHIGV